MCTTGTGADGDEEIDADEQSPVVDRPLIASSSRHGRPRAGRYVSSIPDVGFQGVVGKADEPHRRVVVLVCLCISFPSYASTFPAFRC